MCPQIHNKTKNENKNSEIYLNTKNMNEKEGVVVITVKQHLCVDCRNVRWSPAANSNLSVVLPITRLTLTLTLTQSRDLNPRCGMRDLKKSFTKGTLSEENYTVASSSSSWWSLSSLSQILAMEEMLCHERFRK